MSFDPISAAIDFGSKKCISCGCIRDLSLFRVRTDTGKLRNDCDLCYKSRNRKKYLATKDTFKQQSISWRENNQAANLLIYARTNARTKNLDFNLDISDIKIPETCPYLGTILTNIQGKKYIPTNASIDRIDSSKGYVKGNIQIISRQANVMKNSASKEQLLTFAQNVLRLYGDNDGS